MDWAVRIYIHQDALLIFRSYLEKDLVNIIYEFLFLQILYGFSRFIHTRPKKTPETNLIWNNSV